MYVFLCITDHNRLVGLSTSPSLKSAVSAKTTLKSISASTPPLVSSTPTPPSELHNGVNVVTSVKANNLQRNGIAHKVSVVGEHKTSITNSNQIGRIANCELYASATVAQLLATSSNAISTADKSVAANLTPTDDRSNLSVEALGVLIQYLVFHVSDELQINCTSFQVILRQPVSLRVMFGFSVFFFLVETYGRN